MGTYVVGDIHGCYDEWMELKERIEKLDSEAKFILVGDIIDRGPKVMEMINWAMENITENGKYQMIIGNHEQEKIEWFAEFLEFRETHPWADYRIWRSDYYDFQRTLKKNKIFQEQVKHIVKFFDGLPVYKELFIDTGKRRGRQHYVIVHAYLPPECVNKDETVKKSTLKFPANFKDVERFSDVMDRRSQVIWYRNYCGYKWLKSTIVLHGHTPTISEDIFAVRAESGRICYLQNDINLDCGLVYRAESSNLATIRLEDLQEFYLYPVDQEPENKYDQIARQAQKRTRQELLDLIHGKRRKKENDHPN